MIPELLAIGTFAAGLAGGFALRFAQERRRSSNVDEPRSEREAPPDERFDALVRALPLGVIMLDRIILERERFAGRTQERLVNEPKTVLEIVREEETSAWQP